MANLIITVISIVLVAVAALMGAYYGGSAFMDGQKKAQANTVIAQAEQIAAAWTMQATMNGGDWGNGDLSTLVPDYLSAVPTPPIAGYWFGTGEFNTSFGEPIDRIVFSVDPSAAAAKLCMTVTQMAGGAAALPSKIDFSWYGVTGKFVCAIESYDDNGNSDPSATIPDANDTVAIIYKVR